MKKTERMNLKPGANCWHCAAWITNVFKWALPRGAAMD